MLAATAAASCRLLRRGEEGMRVLPPLLSRALTADAAEALRVEQQQQQEEHRRRPPPPSSSAGIDDESSSSFAHARRLREMEASTSSSSISQSSWLPSAAEVSARLRNERRSPMPLPSTSAFVSGMAPLPSPDDAEPNPNPPLRDWKDALEAAKMLDPRGDPLTDTFGRRHTYLRISLTERCNLRCTYCMPPDGVDLTPKERLLTTAELGRLTRLFASLGVRKVRLTGGEPTLRPDLLELAREISGQPGVDTVGLTTNGVSLGAGARSANVDARIAALRDAGVTSLNVSLDTLRPERFERLARRPRAGHAAALAAIDSASRAGFRDIIKANVVVMKGVNDDEVGDFARWALRAGVNVRFIEFMPFEANSWATSKVVSYREMLAAAREGVRGLGELVPLEEGKEGLFKRRHYDGVAKDFVLSSSSSSPSSSFPSPSSSASSAKRHGVVSFITSMTSPFCSSCTRLRLLADGNLKVCLLGGAEVSLRDAMREGCTESDLSLLIKGALANKKAAHAGMRELAKEQKERRGGGEVGAGRAMVRIGG